MLGKTSKVYRSDYSAGYEHNRLHIPQPGGAVYDLVWGLIIDTYL